ncbi:beta-N-acetylglucosaminidase [Arachidicoccus ginsenosidimutans]|uniref:serine hydrolase domain-containing protein n=1 Tax=Arachidicoccus sp. BS20 TaxID=1850526 RepID=UPI0007F06875|nr:serine hydrolase [Arachidicoccus sp. BS20]ANI88306.1 beta-N-acetylglucosaminidase [Arachidicoccus sp. BS20]
MQRKTIVQFLLFTFSFLLGNAQTHQANLHFLHAMNEVENNVVLLNNPSEIIPLKNLDKRKIVAVHFGFGEQDIFDSLLNKYDFIDTLNAAPYKDSANFYHVEDDLKYFNTVILALNNTLIENKKIQQFINDISGRKNTIIAFFGDGKNLSFFDKMNISLIWYKSENNVAVFVVPQIIFGGIATTALLPKTFSSYKKNTGFKTVATRLKFTVPEDVHVNADDLKSIDSIAAETIEKKASPGLVVLAAKDGKVFFNKAYGTHTYDDNIPDKITDLFDLASVTKITATTPTVMHLYDEGKLNLDTTIGYYLARTRTTPMNPIHVREVMLHQAGFVPFIPFYKYIKQGIDYSTDSSNDYPTKVAEHFYMRKNFFRDVMWTQMMNSPIKTRGKYVYSDLSMYTMQQIVEQLTETPLNKFVLDSFYKPLGMQTAGYLPRKRFSASQIIPTENDTSFRHQLLIGYVHDEGAALKGGVAGHAGLFASSIDLAIYYQMLLNKGSYGGVQYFKPQTVEYFTGKRSTVSRRGLGFDRADTSKNYPSKLASPQTFGHTGFTGIGVWVDVPRNLVYIFLSNRVNPNRSAELIHLDIRPRIEDVLNKAIDKEKNH